MVGGVGGGLFLWSTDGNSGEEGGGGFREIPSVVGVWIFSGTTITAAKQHKIKSTV